MVMVITMVVVMEMVMAYNERTNGCSQGSLLSIPLTDLLCIGDGDGL